MQAQNKPRLGVLALMLEGYEPLFPRKPQYFFLVML